MSNRRKYATKYKESRNDHLFRRVTLTVLYLDCDPLIVGQEVQLLTLKSEHKCSIKTTFCNICKKITNYELFPPTNLICGCRPTESFVVYKPGHAGVFSAHRTAGLFGPQLDGPESEILGVKHQQLLTAGRWDGPVKGKVVKKVQRIAKQLFFFVQSERGNLREFWWGKEQCKVSPSDTS